MTSKGDRYECDACGIVCVVDEVCGCAECDLICCGEPMKKLGRNQLKRNPRKKQLKRKLLRRRNNLLHN